MAQWRTPRQAPGAPNRPTADAHLAALLASPREAPLAVYSSRVVVEAPEDWGHDVVAATVVVEGGRVAAVLPAAGRRRAVGVDPLVVLPGLTVHGATDCDYASCGPLGSSLATAALTDFGRGATTTRDAWRAGATAGVVVCDCVRLSEEERDLASPFCRHEPEARLRAPSPLARLPLCAVDQDHGRARAPSVERHAAKTPHDGPWVGALLEAELRSYAFVSSPKTDSQSSSPGEGKRGLDFSGGGARGLRWVLGCGGGADVHVAAVGADQTLRMVRRAKGNAENDVRVTAATTGLHALLSADDVRPGATLYKVRPPIRHTGHGRALWGALDDGALDCVHSGFDPVAPHLKCAFRGDFARASPGTCAFANADVLVALWARLAGAASPGRARGGWRRGSRNPADALRLAGKGRIAPGRDADLLLFDADGAHERRGRGRASTARSAATSRPSSCAGASSSRAAGDDKVGQRLGDEDLSRLLAAMGKVKIPEHLVKAEAFAGTLLAKPKAPTNADVTKMFRLIKEWPTQQRPNVAPGGYSNPVVEGMVLGLCPNRSGGCSVAQASQQCPQLTKVVTRWAAATLPDAKFRYGSIQVNYNYRARKHIDQNNLGPSFITSLGDHTGGELWTGDRGVLDCHGCWKLFDGNTEHMTQPYEGRDRYSFILFTPDKYNRLTSAVCKTAKDLGVTAATTDGADDAYFSNFRDLGDVDEDAHVAFTEQHHAENPPSFGSGALSVETNGYAAGRGWGWIAWQTDKLGKDKVHVEKFKKNATGIHVVELEVAPPAKPHHVVTFDLVEVHRFNLYQDTDRETARFAKWVDKLPANRVVGVCITDTAMAKRPLSKQVYDTFRLLGAPDSLTLIGYREPFAFLGWKGAPKGAAALAQDAKKQSRLLRLGGLATAPAASR
ncbi:hydrolase [Aureococcus anophagefferens]|nr:hydrolase [Aureococcus anophagefferens]